MFVHFHINWLYLLEYDCFCSVVEGSTSRPLSEMRRERKGTDEDELVPPGTEKRKGGGSELRLRREGFKIDLD